MKNLDSEITFNSFNKEIYHRSELLPELLQLEKEVVHYAIPNSDYVEKTVKLYGVGKYLERLNEKHNYIASKELEIFKSGNREICNQIKAIISGQQGENKVFSYLKKLNCKNYVLKNIELNDDEERTEIDAIVITEKKIYIIEVKNTRRDIFIDENGNYFRTGKYLSLDSNILSKMNTKERLLRKILSNIDVGEINIERIVVFTNYRVEVENVCSSIKTTFLSQLPYIIDRTIGCNIYKSTEMDMIKNAIESSSNKENYSIEFNVNQYKENFVRLMNLLNGIEVSYKPHGVWIKTFFKSCGNVLDVLYAYSNLFINKIGGDLLWRMDL